MARTKIGKEVIELKGAITPGENEKQMVDLDFSDRSDAGYRRVKTNIELPFDKPLLIAGMNSEQIILTLKKENVQ